MASRKQIAAARRNIKKAHAANRHGKKKASSKHHGHRLSRAQYADALSKAVYTLRHTRRRKSKSRRSR